MKNAVFLYTTFIPTKILKWIVYLVYPVLLILLSATFGSFMIGATFVIIPITYSIEMVLNILMFKEIASNEPVRIEYMHTSDGGVGLFGDVMKVDAARHFLTVGLIMLMPCICAGLFHNNELLSFSVEVDGENIFETVNLLYYRLTDMFLLLILIEFVAWLARKLKGTTGIFLLAFVGYVLSMFVGMVTFAIPDKMIGIALGVSIVLYLLVVLLCYKNIMKSEERKFSDFMGKER